MAPYRFAQIQPARHPLGAADDALFGPDTLGIELTDPALARQCGLGNLDPQHGPATAADAPAAIEAACTAPLPPAGACLVTQRPDADALGAMAVLLLRARGEQLDAAAQARVADIARWDRLDRGDWESWHKANPPLFRPAWPVDLAGKPLELRAVDALVRSGGWSIARRVGAVAQWLRRGAGALPRAAVRAALDHEAALLDAWNREAIELRPLADARMVLLLAAPGAPVGGMDLAYRVAPVVLAEGHLPAGRKLTVAQFAPGWIDLPALLGTLQRMEPGWGGQPARIIGSPQGAASQLPLAEVAALMQQHLLRHIRRK